MEVMDYCKNMEMELTNWKARVFDLQTKVDALGSAEKERILGHVGDLHNLVVEMEQRVDQLRNECPLEWDPQKQEIDDGHVDVRSRYDETMKLIGEASPVSIPG